MTVGITLSNGKEAVVLSDSRQTTQNVRTANNSFKSFESDSAQKLVAYNSDNHPCLINGSGSLNLVNYVFYNLNAFKADSLPNFIQNIKNSLYNNNTKNISALLDSEKNEIYLKASVIDNPEKKEEYIKSNISRITERRDFTKSGFDINLLITGYDPTIEAIRIYGADSVSSGEGFTSYAAIGSGATEVLSYFYEKMPGANIQTMPLSELMFFTLGSFCRSNLNVGVGGSPTIAHISKQGPVILDSKNTISASNLVGAYYAGVNDNRLTKEYVISALDDILHNDANSSKLAKELKLTKYAFESIHIPYSSWVESANKNR